MIPAHGAWPLLLLESLAASLAYAGCGWVCTLPLIVLMVLTIYLYREPFCHVPPSPLAVVSPVHGRVTLREPARDPYLRREAMKIEIRMPLLGPFALRSPIEGQVMQQWSLSGRSEPAPVAAGDGFARPPADQEARFAVWLQTDERDDVVLVLRGAFISRRVQCAIGVGERVGQGQRCGRVQFAATAELYLPLGSRLEAAPGDALEAGSAIIATFIHKATPPGPETLST